jgi:hypothetical protein
MAVLFTRTSDLVQRLQIARRELALESALAKLDKYNLLILDDIAYVSKDQAETSVLFELIGSRYERRSMLITANQPFGEWGNAFHHSSAEQPNACSSGKASMRSKRLMNPEFHERCQQTSGRWLRLADEKQPASSGDRRHVVIRDAELHVGAGALVRRVGRRGRKLNM